MSVMIRLTRSGSKKLPLYRIVAINKDERRDGRPLEFLGNYNPHANPAVIVFDREKTQAWLDKGAKMSDTVAALYKASAAN